MTVILTSGLPGSGKSTWAREHAKQFNGDMLLTSRDDIRAMLGFGPVGTKEQEEIVSKMQDDIIVRAVKSGKGIIVHDTNLNKKSPTRIKKLFDGDVTFAVADFTNVPVATCIAQDKARLDAVGEAVIRNMARQLQNPWRLTAEFMNDVELSSRYTPKSDLQDAIVVDIDGTLAEHVMRSPYDYGLVLTDASYKEIIDLVNMYAREGHEIIVMSGRPDINNVRSDTVRWLRREGVQFDQLFMRPADMLTVNDADVKQHLFDKYVRNSYHVHLWLDDRNRVVRRMRKLGIRVLQVRDGEF